MMRKIAGVFDLLLRNWLVTAFAASAAMLAIAHAFETFGGLAPCLLCLKQREVYWAAMAIAAVGFVLRFSPLHRRLDRLFAVILALCFAYGTFVAVRHAGAEWKWWPGPAACAANRGGVSAAEMAALLRGEKLAMPSCEDAAWVFLGLSMAGWNALISLGLVVMSALAALRREPNRV